jgi:hypothetical protein
VVKEEVLVLALGVSQLAPRAKLLVGLIPVMVVELVEMVVNM